MTTATLKGIAFKNSGMRVKCVMPISEALCFVFENDKGHLFWEALFEVSEAERHGLTCVEFDGRYFRTDETLPGEFWFRNLEYAIKDAEVMLCEQFGRG